MAVRENGSEDEIVSDLPDVRHLSLSDVLALPEEVLPSIERLLGRDTDGCG